MKRYHSNKKLIYGDLIVFLILLFSINITNGQKRLGLHIENRSGINATWINPANSFLSPYKWDANIVSAGFFFGNNYGFLKNTNTLKLLQNRKIIHIEYDSSKYIKTKYPPGTFVLDFYKMRRESYFAISGFLSGPSFSFKLNKNNSIGFVSAHRFYGNIENIPEELNYYTFYDKPYFDPFPITPFRSGFMYWKEYGLNFTHKIKGYNSHTIVGATIKYLSGSEALFFDNNETFLFQQMRNDSIAATDKLHIQYGFTGFNNGLIDFMFAHYGRGISIDLGTTFVAGENTSGHKYRLGISLLDAGFINFYKKSKQYTFNIDTLTELDIGVIDENDYHFTKPDSINQSIIRQIHYNGDEITEENSFKLLLPMTISIQFDYSLSNSFFINAVMVQRLIYAGNSASAQNLFAITPRFEQKWFSTILPVVIYDWKDVRLGFSIRVAFLTVGSDNIFSVFSNQRHYTGTDFYAGIKLFPFSLNRNKNLNKNIKCYKF